MPLYVLDNTKLYEADIDNILEADRGNTVISGCSVAAHAAPDTGIRVAAGVIHALGQSVAVAQTDLDILVGHPADGTNTRIDLVHVDMTTGVPAIVFGTAGQLKPGSLPVNSILLGYVSIAAAAVNIQNSNITQRQLASSWRAPGGLRANRPAAGYRGRTWYSNDPDQPDLERDNGTTWDSLTGRYPNQHLDGDFARCTVFGLAMAEVFADTNGYVVVSGAAPTVASNIVTSTAANELAWCNQSFVWRDGRMSASYKVVATAGIYELRWKVDATHYVSVKQNNGNFTIVLANGGGGAVQATTAQAITLNEQNWIELDIQGAFATAKIYRVAAPWAVKASATLLTTLSVNLGLVPGTAWGGAHPSVVSDQATAQWGGIATINGGVYVEAWLPEGLNTTINDPFTGTRGGQAIGIDESVDAGPLGYQSALTAYIPHSSRSIVLAMRCDSSQLPDRDLIARPSTPYTGSVYIKHNASSNFVNYVALSTFTAANAFIATDITLVDDGSLNGNTWKRYAASNVTGATARFSRQYLIINYNNNLTGTARIMLAQLEQGLTATAWRNAPSDDAPMIWYLSPIGQAYTATASGTPVAYDERNAAVNIRLPWNAIVEVRGQVPLANNTLGAVNRLIVYKAAGTTLDPLGTDSGYATQPVANHLNTVFFSAVGRLPAGKTRLQLMFYTSAGTLSPGQSVGDKMMIVATRAGK